MRLLIVGGVAGGATAAARARRLDEEAEIIMFERGEHVSFANCGLPYYIGGEIAERGQLLVADAELLRKRYRIEVRVRSEVKRIYRETQEIEVEDLVSGNRYREKYDKLILATGAAPVRPPLPGIDLEGIFTLRSIPDADAVKTYLSQTGAKRAAVIGGGFIGMEMAENLRRLGIEVSVVEMLDQVLPPIDPEMAAPVHQELRLNGVKLFLGQPVASFARDEAGLHVQLKDGRDLACDAAILCIGVRPEVSLAREADLDIGELGGIATDAHMATSDPKIYAVGDAVEVVDSVGGSKALIPLGGPANRQGRIAADCLFGRDSAYRGTQGTAVVRVFDLTVASTGASEKVLRRNGTPYQKCYTHGHSHALYYPGAVSLAIKLLFAPEDGRILGAQIVGGEGADKRIDVLATAIRAGMTVYDLEHLELAYAPQYGSAKDPVNIAGSVGANLLRGDLECVEWDQVEELRGQGCVFVDVRVPEEMELNQIPEAINVPVDELHDRMDELPKDRPLVVYCGTGRRSYTAYRALKLSGFQDVKNLDGGWLTYGPTIKTPEPENGRTMTPEPEEKQPEVPAPVTATATLDACGMQCPGPIVQLSKKIKELKPGDVLEISVTDAGFAKDLPAWCVRTGHELVSIEKQGPVTVGRVRLPAQGAPGEPAASSAGNDKTIVVFSNDLDRVMAAFIIANGAAAMGRKVTLFFTFWGLNVLRKPASPPVVKGAIDRMFGWMMPKGPARLKLSKMNMAGMGTAMMKMVMQQKNVQSLPELIDLAREQGVRLVACTMSMDVMGLKKEELIDGIEEAGVGAYLGDAETADVNLFI